MMTLSQFTGFPNKAAQQKVRPSTPIRQNALIMSICPEWEVHKATDSSSATSIVVHYTKKVLIFLITFPSLLISLSLFCYSQVYLYLRSFNFFQAVCSSWSYMLRLIFTVCKYCPGTKESNDFQNKLNTFLLATFQIKSELYINFVTIKQISCQNGSCATRTLHFNI